MRSTTFVLSSIVSASAYADSNMGLPQNDKYAVGTQGCGYSQTLTDLINDAPSDVWVAWPPSPCATDFLPLKTIMADDTYQTVVESQRHGHQTDKNHKAIDAPTMECMLATIHNMAFQGVDNPDRDITTTAYKIFAKLDLAHPQTIEQQANEIVNYFEVDIRTARESHSFDDTTRPALVNSVTKELKECPNLFKTIAIQEKLREEAAAVFKQNLETLTTKIHGLTEWGTNNTLYKQEVEAILLKLPYPSDLMPSSEDELKYQTDVAYILAHPNRNTNRPGITFDLWKDSKTFKEAHQGQTKAQIQAAEKAAAAKVVAAEKAAAAKVEAVMKATAAKVEDAQISLKAAVDADEAYGKILHNETVTVEEQNKKDNIADAFAVESIAAQAAVDKAEAEGKELTDKAKAEYKVDTGKEYDPDPDSNPAPAPDDPAPDPGPTNRRLLHAMDTDKKMTETDKKMRTYLDTHGLILNVENIKAMGCKTTNKTEFGCCIDLCTANANCGGFTTSTYPDPDDDTKTETRCFFISDSVDPFSCGVSTAPVMIKMGTDEEGKHSFEPYKTSCYVKDKEEHLLKAPPPPQPPLPLLPQVKVEVEDDNTAAIVGATLGGTVLLAGIGLILWKTELCQRSASEKAFNSGSGPASSYGDGSNIRNSEEHLVLGSVVV